MTPPVVLSFSGGKDSVLALDALRGSGRWDVRALAATFVEDDRTLVMHEVPERLIALQASSLGLPLIRMLVPRAPANAVYEERLAATLAPLRDQGISHIAFGDLFLADLKAYRDGLMARLGFEALYPLWERDTRALADSFVRRGYRGVTVCVDGAKLGSEWAGREMDQSFFAALPQGVDPCGENGEFHSFVHDGPGFAYPVRFKREATVARGAFHCTPLAALAGEACARCGAIFECGMKADVAHCWCADTPAITIDPAIAGCLCPRCLAEQVRVPRKT